MDLEISGKRALVLASSQGLGLGIAEALAAEGVNVLICGRSHEKLASAAAAINGRKMGEAHFAAIDLTDRNSAQTLYDAAGSKLGGVDILINNTGGPPPGSVLEPDAETWRSFFDVMVLRLIEITNLCLPAMRAAKWGRIVTVTSMGVQQPIPILGISNTLRPALVGWNKSLATALAAEGITANVLLPGRISTERTATIDQANAHASGKSVADIEARSKAGIPVGRYGRVEEFGATAAFLCGRSAGYITGSALRVDGGVIASV
ncbi:3-oxoacyl-[acyl-carrier protein] reductase [hydrothermal vent metagenome]|uniref:3-oxoacyl-[acyl-carrier protein] reductase n=1 Tax=hydrothermal vent metagenome TaxID=652676 RepID=A0A3B0TEI2_9ZZZZ